MKIYFNDNEKLQDGEYRTIISDNKIGFAKRARGDIWYSCGFYDIKNIDNIKQEIRKDLAQKIIESLYKSRKNLIPQVIEEIINNLLKEYKEI